MAAAGGSTLLKMPVNPGCPMSLSVSKAKEAERKPIGQCTVDLQSSEQWARYDWLFEAGSRMNGVCQVALARSYLSDLVCES
jgi:hypothetical protein